MKVFSKKAQQLLPQQNSAHNAQNAENESLEAQPSGIIQPLIQRKGKQTSVKERTKDIASICESFIAIQETHQINIEFIENVNNVKTLDGKGWAFITLPNNFVMWMAIDETMATKEDIDQRFRQSTIKFEQDLITFYGSLQAFLEGNHPQKIDIVYATLSLYLHTFRSKKILNKTLRKKEHDIFFMEEQITRLKPHVSQEYDEFIKCAVCELAEPKEYTQKMSAKAKKMQLPISDRFPYQFALKFNFDADELQATELSIKMNKVRIPVPDYEVLEDRVNACKEICTKVKLALKKLPKTEDGLLCFDALLDFYKMTFPILSDAKRFAIQQASLTKSFSEYTDKQLKRQALIKSLVKSRKKGEQQKDSYTQIIESRLVFVLQMNLDLLKKMGTDLDKYKPNIETLKFYEEQWLALDQRLKEADLKFQQGYFAAPEVNEEFHIILQEDEQFCAILEHTCAQEQARNLELIALVNKLKTEEDELKLKQTLEKESLLQQKRYQELVAFRESVKEREEAFKKEVSNKAKLKKDKKKEELVLMQQEKEMETKLKQEHDDAHAASRVNLKTKLQEKGFERFVDLIETLFSDPIPNYYIKLSDVENLIVFLGGRISSPGSGGSHRCITLIQRCAYILDEDKDLPLEKQELNKKEVKIEKEKVGIVEAHKKGAVRGRISNSDVKSIRMLLIRVGITLASVQERVVSQIASP